MRKYGPLIAIVLAATAARLLFYNNWSYSNDELSALSRLNFDSFSALISKGVDTDGHPALVQVFLYYWTSLFGTTETVVRLPFVIAGILSVAITYVLTRRWFGGTTAIMVSLCMALLEFPILYSQLARPYSMGLLFVMTSALLWDSLLFRSQKKQWELATLTGISFALAMYTHYFSFLSVLIMGLTGLFFMNKSTRGAYLYAGVLAAVLFAPHIPVTLHHLTVGGVEGWLAKPEPWWLITHLKYVFNDSWWLFGITLAAGVYFLIRKVREEGWTKFQSIALLFFGLLFLSGFLYSIFVNAVIQHSTMLFGLPFLLMLLFSGFSQIKRQNLVYIITALLLIVPPWGISGFYSTQHFGEFRGVAKKWVEWSKEVGQENTTSILYTNDPHYLEFYFDEDSVHFDYVFYNQSGEIDSLASDSSFGKRPYVLFGWTKPYRTQVYDIIRSRYPYIVEDMDYDNLSRITLFSKTPGKPYDSIFRKDKILLKEIHIDFNDQELSKEGIDIDKKNLTETEGESCYNAEKKFNLTYRTTLASLPKAVKEVEISGKLYAAARLQKASFTCSMGPEKGKRKVWRSIPLSRFQADTSRWQPFVFTPKIEAVMTSQDQLTLFLWNPQKETLFIDDLSIKLYGE